MKEVYLLAGGNSIKDLDLSKLKGKDVIAINKSIIDFPEAKYFVTMDNSLFRKLDLKSKVLKNSPANKIFIANLVPDYMEEKNGQIVDTRWNIIYNFDMFDVVIKSKKYEEFGFEFKDFRSGKHSGYCAIQLAIILGYTEINLVGYDLIAEGTTHYHGGYGESLENFNKKLEEYYQYLKEAILELHKKSDDIMIYSCSKISRLNKFVPYKEL